MGRSGLAAGAVALALAVPGAMLGAVAVALRAEPFAAACFVAVAAFFKPEAYGIGQPDWRAGLDAVLGDLA